MSPTVSAPGTGSVSLQPPWERAWPAPEPQQGCGGPWPGLGCRLGGKVSCDGGGQQSCRVSGQQLGLRHRTGATSACPAGQEIKPPSKTGHCVHRGPGVPSAHPLEACAPGPALRLHPAPAEEVPGKQDWQPGPRWQGRTGRSPPPRAPGVHAQEAGGRPGLASRRLDGRLRPSARCHH